MSGKRESCEWKLTEPDYAVWASSCGEEFIIIEGILVSQRDEVLAATAASQEP